MPTDRRVVGAAVAALRGSLDDLARAQQQVVAPMLGEQQDQHRALLEALAKAHRGRASVQLDVRTRGQLLRVVQEQLLQATRGLVASAPRAVGQVVLEATASVGRAIQRMSGRDMPQVGASGAAEYRAMVESLARRGAQAVGLDAAEAVLRRARMVRPGEDKVADLIDAASEAYDGQRWRLVRLARTEASVAFNGQQRRAIEAASPVFPGIMLRWTELVDDLTGKPFDNRVAGDSMSLHGQVARPGATFVMPNDPRAPTKLIGKRWEHPPNRPNDRAVLAPWMHGWRIPGWVWDGQKRVPA